MLDAAFFIDLGRKVTTNALTGVTLSAIALLSSDVLFSTPRLSGFWNFEIQYAQTGHSPFQDLELRYHAVIIQQGLNFTGTGEKDAERLPNANDWMEYGAAGRVPIEITGYIQRRFIGRDSVILHIKELGNRRQSSAFHELVFESSDFMEGKFDTTVADASGPVTWQRDRVDR